MHLVGGAAYGHYMGSAAWRKKRRERLELDSFRCTRCGETERLEVHHVDYCRLGDEPLEHLLTLCHACHCREHGRDPDIPSEYPMDEAFWAAMERERQQEELEDAQQAILDSVLRELAA